uniref:Uncharacterized protein n=1 Tax=Arundo donax TaxID=35708 RepID=A0A0A8ZJI4_ARUDO
MLVNCRNIGNYFVSYVLLSGSILLYVRKVSLRTTVDSYIIQDRDTFSSKNLMPLGLQNNASTSTAVSLVQHRCPLSNILIAFITVFNISLFQ